MCIIAIKQSGTPIDWDILDACDMNNPDGSGFAYPTDTGVKIRKGFFKIQELEQAIADEGIDTTETPIMFHFRIATHGKVAPATCHPFPLSHLENQLTTLDMETEIAVSHNGIVPNMGKDRYLSDTMIFIRDYLAPLGTKVLDPAIQPLLEQAADSKLAFMTADGEVLTIGKFITDNGWKFSNDTYLRHWYDNLSSSAKHFSLGGSQPTSSERMDSEWTDDDWDSWCKSAEDYTKIDGGWMDYCDRCGKEYLEENLETSEYLGGEEHWYLCDTCKEIIPTELTGGK